jgi:flavin reductase (DIM6/NTAB) family NADH-FMN oxidoreductase RutF
MEVDFNQLTPSQVYHSIVQTLIPRPIAWVLSLNKNQSCNLAPFSYFNAVSSDPPLVMISVGKKADGSFKDTKINIEARKHFVIHLPSVEQALAVNNSSATLANEQSEVDALDLETTDFELSPLPRLKDCPVAYACELFDILEIGQTPMAMILGKITALYIDDDIIEQPLDNQAVINSSKMNPLARLGGIDYSSLGKTFSIKRP